MAIAVVAHAIVANKTIKSPNVPSLKLIRFAGVLVVTSKPDIIIMDHRMPVKDGIEATKEILQMNPKAKIIFASADNSVKEYAQMIGVISFKNKPFSNELLIKNIEKALQNAPYQSL